MSTTDGKKAVLTLVGAKLTVSAKAYGFFEGISTGTEAGLEFTVDPQSEMNDVFAELGRIRQALEVFVWKHEAVKVGSAQLNVLASGFLRNVLNPQASKQKEEDGLDGI